MDVNVKTNRCVKICICMNMKRRATVAYDIVPDCWCDTGLYAKIRHPNYTGELMFWFGNFLAGLPAMVFSGVWPMIPALLGGSFINFLMNNQAKGQDEKQAAGMRSCPLVCFHSLPSLDRST